MRWIFIIGAILLSLAVPATARAEAITYEFSGDVWSAANSAFGVTLDGGSIVTGTFVVDTDTVDSDSQAWVGVYEHAAVTGFSLDLDGTQVSSSAYYILVADDPSTTSDTLVVDGSAGFSVGGLASESGDQFLMILSPPEATFSSDLLSQDMTLDQSKVGSLQVRDASTGQFISLWVNSVAVKPVPEPGTLGLLVLGLSLVGVTHRRRVRS